MPYTAFYGENLPTLDAQFIPTKTGYTFIGFYNITDGTEGTKYYNADGTSAHIWDIASNVILIAQFTINQYTITFNSNGGSEIAAITQNYNTVVTAPTDPTKTGYTFLGWFADSALTQSYTFTTMPAKNITIYAKWIRTAVNVDELITDIGAVEYTNASKGKIDVARSAYNALSTAEKASVTKYGTLTHDEEIYANVDAVVSKINKIGTVEYNKETKELIDAARSGYNGLTDEEKAMNPAKFAVLEEDEADYSNLDKNYKIKVAAIVAACAIGLCLIILLLSYFIAFFGNNKWIIEKGKVVRAYVCKKPNKNGENVLKTNLRKVFRPSSKIYKTKYDAFVALNKTQAQDD